MDKYEKMFLADDLYDEALYETSKVKKRKLLNEALKLNPTNYECEIELAKMETTNEKVILKLEKLKTKIKYELTKEGYFNDEHIGDFWGIMETRPYMRCLYALMDYFTKIEQYNQALEYANEMLRLCEADNLGIRYKVLPLYILCNKNAKAKEYIKENNDGSLSALINEIAYYLHNDQTKDIDKVLAKIMKIDIETFDYLIGMLLVPKKEIKIVINNGSYSYGTIEEAITTIYQMPKPIITLFENYIKSCG